MEEGGEEEEQGRAAEISRQDCCLEIRVQVIRKKKGEEREREGELLGVKN